MTTTDIDEIEKRWACSDSSNSSESDAEQTDDQVEQDPEEAVPTADNSKQPIIQAVTAQELDITEG